MLWFKHKMKFKKLIRRILKGTCEMSHDLYWLILIANLV
jgi:hypothetical protein